MNSNNKELNPEELKPAAGGTFTWNFYKKQEYESFGIKVITHFFKKDEFWWNGKDIGEKGANSVVYYNRIKHCAPGSLDEAVSFFDANEYHKAHFRHGR